MKFSLDTNSSALSINAYSEQGIQIADRWHKTHLLLTPEQLFENWQAPEQLDALTLGDFESALIPELEVMILGTGEQLRFPPPTLNVSFAERGIGLEVMSTQAACRTYNILLSEDRRVAAALMQGV